MDIFVLRVTPLRHRRSADASPEAYVYDATLMTAHCTHVTVFARLFLGRQATKYLFELWTSNGERWSQSWLLRLQLRYLRRQVLNRFELYLRLDHMELTS
jgi:hypothetical protein